MPLYSRLTAAEKDQVLRELAQEIAFRNLRPAWVPGSNHAKTYGKTPYNGRDFPDKALFRESICSQ
jgi:hypothetical protein